MFLSGIKTIPVITLALSRTQPSFRSPIRWSRLTIVSSPSPLSPITCSTGTRKGEGILSYLVTEAFAVSVARAVVSEETTVAPTKEKKKYGEGEDEGHGKTVFLD